MVRREGREDGEKGREGGWCLITKSIFSFPKLPVAKLRDRESLRSV